ncbi:MAG: hypothetical protein QOI83_1395, partial [Streptomycetaceae bacterium]|nr:hypothetical protein [Streptomycetaceae bacterium]
DVFFTQFLTSELVEEVQSPQLFLTFRKLIRDTDTPEDFADTNWLRNPSVIAAGSRVGQHDAA